MATDSKGRPIGYSHTAECDHPECAVLIHRGFRYACGGAHGQRDCYDLVDVCERYFCDDHLRIVVITDPYAGLAKTIQACLACTKQLVDTAQGEVI